MTSSNTTSKEQEVKSKDSTTTQKELCAFVTGSNRGIGLGFVKHLLKRKYTVFCACRDPSSATALIELRSQYKFGPYAQDSKLCIVALDSTSDEHISIVKKFLSGKAIDILILNAGMMGDRQTKFGSITREDLMLIFNVNTVGPLMLAQALYENVAKSERKQIIGISSVMGSIANTNGTTNYFSYRISKAGMNMALQSVVRESINNKNDVHTLILHPGWVQTNMGGKNASIDVNESVEQMLAVIDNYKELKNGGYYYYNGKEMLW